MLKFILGDPVSRLEWRDFKTSYVEVYRQKRQESNGPTLISKHLMLKFILNQKQTTLFVGYFKTSYVEVYRLWRTPGGS